MMMQDVLGLILGGDQGTRLYPLTKKLKRAGLPGANEQNRDDPGTGIGRHRRRRARLKQAFEELNKVNRLA